MYIKIDLNMIIYCIHKLYHKISQHYLGSNVFFVLSFDVKVEKERKNTVKNLSYQPPRFLKEKLVNLYLPLRCHDEK
jgi:hypothetical protein